MKERRVKFPLRYAQDFMLNGLPVYPEEVAIRQARRLAHSILVDKTLQDVEDYLTAAICKAHAKAKFDDYASIATMLALDVKVVAIYEDDIKEKADDTERNRTRPERTSAGHNLGNKPLPRRRRHRRPVPRRSY